MVKKIYFTPMPCTKLKPAERRERLSVNVQGVGASLQRYVCCQFWDAQRRRPGLSAVRFCRSRPLHLVKLLSDFAAVRMAIVAVLSVFGRWCAGGS
jgi:hypothetical protein